MKKLKTITFVLAVCTALVVPAGFKTGKTSLPGSKKASEELSNKKPFAVPCLEFIEGQFHTTGILTACPDMEGATCILTDCSTTPAESGKKVLLFRCVNVEGKTVAIVNGCTTAHNSYCAKGACPPGTSGSTFQ